MTTVPIGHAALAQLLPLHLRLDAGGRIVGAGGTMRKLIGAAVHVGDAFRPVRGDWAGGAAPFVLSPGGRVFLALIGQDGVVLRGNGVPLDDGGVLLNLGFGVGLADAVRRFALTDHDFAAADLAKEMLFLHEANGAMLSELSRSNLRLEEARRAAEVQAFTDPLTGLYNRRGLEITLNLAAEGRADTDHFALIHMDLDLFKEVNDSFGHAAGDEVLRRVADRLRHATRAHDTVARVGGDEFVLILPGLVDRDQLLAFGKRVIAAIEAPVRVGDHICGVSASMGITVSSAYDILCGDTMLADADRALYAAKDAGRGRAFIATGGGGVAGGVDGRDTRAGADGGKGGRTDDVTV